MKIKYSLLSAAILTAASFSSSAAPMYSILDLGTIHSGSGRSSAYSISDTGLVVGNSRGRLPTIPGETTRTNTRGARFLVEQGTVHDIGGLGYSSGHGSAVATAVNNGGAAAGYAPAFNMTEGVRHYQSFVHHYKTGYMQNIGTLGNGAESRAYGINNNGKVVGWSNTKADGSDNVAYIHDIKTNTMSSLGGDLLGGSRSFAFDINDSDLVVGNAFTANGSGAAFMYQYGGTENAVNMGSLDNSNFAEARAVNENAVATGWSKVAGVDTAFIYDQATGMQEIAGLGGGSRGYDINDAGVVVGYADDGVSTDHRGRAVKEAVISMDGKFVPLYSLLSPSEQALWKGLTLARSINNDGTIVGTGRFWTDKANDKAMTMAFQITAVPVPGAIFLMGPALGLLGFMSKRNKQAVA